MFLLSISLLTYAHIYLEFITCLCLSLPCHMLLDISMLGTDVPFAGDGLGKSKRFYL